MRTCLAPSIALPCTRPSRSSIKRYKTLCMCRLASFKCTNVTSTPFIRSALVNFEQSPDWSKNLVNTRKIRDLAQSVMYAFRNAQSPNEVRMADKQSDADKAQAMKEYHDARDAAIKRMAALRAVRLARDAEAQTPAKTKNKKPSPK